MKWHLVGGGVDGLSLLLDNGNARSVVGGLNMKSNRKRKRIVILK